MNPERQRRMRTDGEFLRRMNGGIFPTVPPEAAPGIFADPSGKDLREGPSCNGTYPNEREDDGTVPVLARPSAPSAECLRAPSLAMVYSPTQKFGNLYSPAEGLRAGSLFRELIKPWEAGGRMK